MCSPSVLSQCVLPVCPTSVYFRGGGSGPQPAASPQCVLRILCIRWYAELHVPSAALIYRCSCKSANALLAERSHGERSFARILMPLGQSDWTKMENLCICYYFGSGRHSVEDWARGMRFLCRIIIVGRRRKTDYQQQGSTFSVCDKSCITKLLRRVEPQQHFVRMHIIFL